MTSLYHQRLALPAIPEQYTRDIVPLLLADQQAKRDVSALGHAAYTLPSSIMDPLYAFLNENIMEGGWYIQYFDRSPPWHRDPKTSTRFLYFLDLGGDSVITQFGTRYEQRVVESASFQLQQWNLVKTDVWHRVCGMEPYRWRVALSCRVFGYDPVDYPVK